MFTLKNFPENKRCVVIEDRIGLPALTRMLKWSPNLLGPVLHPTHFDLEVIEALLMDGCKKLYVLNPEDYNMRVLLTKENLKTPYVELFYPTEENEEEVDLPLVPDTTGEIDTTVNVFNVIDDPGVQILTEVVEPIQVTSDSVNVELTDLTEGAETEVLVETIDEVPEGADTEVNVELTDLTEGAETEVLVETIDETIDVAVAETSKQTNHIQKPKMNQSHRNKN